ncbi:LLM class flavin-dependent oxidoreductase [Rhodopseudomonas telluris]|uniref:LLM class flavin-dependent oxidoreductase n=1 Tax=Rhodopseudomonas telluris TaxID=644215 RepID=A0ABV6EZ99_9BRAD
MALEFIGFIGNNNSSETIVRSGPVLDIDHVETVAKAHENAGFDRALLAFHSDLPDPLQVGQHIASVTQRLNVFIAQRPGFTAPTVFARQFATLDHLTKGRVSLNVITGGDHAELVHDGNTVPDKDERYARTSEFLDIVRSEWSSDTPFDYDGKYYQVKGGFSQIKPLRPEGIPVFIAGASDAAIKVAGRHADIFALWGETYEEVRSIIGRVKAAAAKNNRPSPRFSLSFRPILAETEELAWAKADSILARAQAVQEVSGFKRGAGQPANEGSRRLLALAAKGERLDKRLWTGLAKLTGARGNSTSLVGTPQQVAEALLDYYALGVDIFLIRGFDPLVDAIDYGRELIPLTRELVARREAVAA